MNDVDRVSPKVRAQPQDSAQASKTSSRMHRLCKILSRDLAVQLIGNIDQIVPRTGVGLTQLARMNFSAGELSLRQKVKNSQN